MKPRRPRFIAECRDLVRPTDADDVLALALSMIRGRAFGRRSTEVQFLRLALERSGYRIIEDRT